MAAPKKTQPKKIVPNPIQTPRDAQPEHYEAARAEAENGARMEPVDVLKVVQWRGHDLRVPPSIEEWDIEIQEAAENGQILRHVSLLLGDDQFQQLRDDKAIPKMGDLQDLVQTITKQAYGGAKLGE